MVDPDLTLSEQERQDLSTMVSLRGFEHFKKLALAECARFDVQLKNLEPSAPNYDSALKQYHALSKAAAQFWTGLIQRVNSEISAHETEKKRRRRLRDLRPQDVEADPTEEILGGNEADHG